MQGDDRPKLDGKSDTNGFVAEMKVKIEHILIGLVRSLLALMMVVSPAHPMGDAEAIGNARLLERTLRCAELSARFNGDEREHELQESAVSVAQKFDSAAQAKQDPYDAAFWERVPINVRAAWFGSSNVLKLKRLRILIASDVTFELPRTRGEIRKFAQKKYREEKCKALPRATK